MIKALISIGAGKSQIEIIKKAVALGYYVIALDKNKNAPGFRFCSEVIVCSTHNSESACKKINKLTNKKNNLGLICTSSGPPVITAAYIARNLSIPSIPIKSAKIAINKHLLRHHCKKYNISQPKFEIRKKGDFSPPSIAPVIVKPSLSLVGKKGISLLNEPKDIKKLFNLASRFTENNYVLFEEYIRGDDVSLVGFIDKGKIYFSTLLDEKNFFEKGILKGYGYQGPSKYTNTKAHKILMMISKRLINSLNIDSSPFSFAFRINKNGIPYLIEVHLELVGDLIFSHLLPKIYDINFMEFAIKFITKSTKLRPLKSKNFVYLKYKNSDKTKCTIRKKLLML